MHIKQVVISGFRSFRHQPEIEPFSPGHNVIIGRNGSGKSNFFAAIQFVLLSQRFLHLRQEERQALLHEGAGSNVMSAFVEVIFDNSEGRMTVDGDEVVLRRTIGVKKDEFFLNRKRVTKQEVSSLLESAGFSRSNPYYIVQQGKVNHLTLMKDEERLNLLKEVAGTKVYEERREESLQIMKETNSKRDKIEEVVAYIDERLNELEEEKEELKAYQQLDKDRRALEYTLYDKELKQAREDIQKSEELRLRESTKVEALHKKLHDCKEVTNRIERQLGTLVEELLEVEGERASVEKDRETQLHNSTRLEIEVNDLQKKVREDEHGQKVLKQQLDKLNGEIASIEKDLETRVEPAYEEAKGAAGAAEIRLQEFKKRKDELYEKQGRGTRFRTVDERNKHLKKMQTETQGFIGDKERLIRNAESTITTAAKKVEEDKTGIERKEKEIAKLTSSLEGIGVQLTQKTQERSQVQEEQKALEKTMADIGKQKQAAQGRLNEAERDLGKSMPRNIQKGLDSLTKLVKSENTRGYHGPVYSLIKLKDPKFRTAVEVAAGNSLMNVVVDNDEIAAQLMKKLERQNLGRVTFMPLNRLRVKSVHIPESSDAVSLLSTALEYPQEVEKAMRQIFGRKLLARDIEVAARFSEEADLDAVTLDGDEVSRKGLLYGGSHEGRVNKLASYESINAAKEELERLTAEEDELQKKYRNLRQTATTGIISQLQKLQAQQSREKNDINTLSDEIKSHRRSMQAWEDKAAKAQESLPELLRELEGHRRENANLEEEMASPLQTNLSSSELQELNSIDGEVAKVKKVLKQLSQALQDKANERSKLRSRLNENLKKQRQDILDKLSPEHGGTGHVCTMEFHETRRLLEEKKLELQKTIREVEAIEEKVRKMDEDTAAKKKQENNLKAQLEENRTQEIQVNESIAEIAKAQEKLVNKRSYAIHKREDNLKKIQELGSLPAAELESYKNLGIKQLVKNLKKANEDLKKYSHVNKKALDQYVNFSEQREDLLKRKKELDEGSKAIDDLIQSLDRQKDEAILRTFKGVSQHFSEVFKELVPNGYGRMVMKTTTDRNDGEEGLSQEAKEPISVNEFVGVQIQVSFTGQGDRYLMQQLSGGQKALVAMALIFSIQRCDPAPFYLFDEIDQALDSTYRAAVAALIERQAHSKDSPAQFITSTFRPELVRVAERCYGVSHQNKVSNFHILEKSVALDFVAELMHEEEAVGKVTKVPTNTSRSGRRESKQGGEDDEPEEEEEEGEGGGEEEEELTRPKKRKSRV